MHILCPHCRNAIEVVQLTAHAEIHCPSCGSSFNLDLGSTKPEEVLHKLGKFELLGAVGSGAFGTVYRARDPELDRTVAIKVPRGSNLGSGDHKDRFLREARSVAQLRHPSIVPIYEVGQADDTPYLVSEFVQGITLADLLTSRRLGFREAAELIAAVADALQYAHDQGVVHRDVKPSNIMLEHCGVVSGENHGPADDSPLTTHHSPKLMDFGLAKRDAGEITMTIDGQVLGTPAYMSPEQARGEAHRVDGRSDVYSLGVILYELLTGELPFRGNTRMLLHQVLHDEPRPPRSLNDRVPRDLQTICLKAMAKERARRYQKAAELTDDLRRFLNDEPIRARPVGRIERAWRWCRRRPAIASLLAVIFVGAAASITAITGLWLSEKDQKEQTQEALQKTDRARKNEEAEKLKARTAQETAEKAKQAETDERRKVQTGAYFLSIALAHRELLANNVTHARQILNDCPQELRGWEWHYLNRLCAPELLTLNHEGPVGSAAISADGKRIASAWIKRQVRERQPPLDEVMVSIWDATNGELLRTLPTGKPRLGRVRISTDGLLVAAVSLDQQNKPELKIWSLEAGKELLTAPAGVAGEQTAEITDGRRVTIANKDGALIITDAAKGQALASLPDILSSRTRVSPDGKWSVSTDSSTLTVRDRSTGQAVSSFRGHTGVVVLVWALCFSPDGRRVASGGTDRVVRIWETATGKELMALHGHMQSPSEMEFSPDGRILVSGGSGLEMEHEVKVWNAITGQPFMSLRPGGVSEVQFTLEGRRLLTAGGKAVKLWDLSTTPECRSLPRMGGDLRCLTFSKDGRLLATGATDAINIPGKFPVALLDATSGRLLRTLYGHKKDITAVAFSPDGTRVASGSHDATVRIWEVATGKVLYDLKARTKPGKPPFYSFHHHCLAFSPDGNRLFSAGDDETVKVWDANTGAEVGAFDINGSALTLVVSADGSRLTAFTSKGNVVMLDAATGRELGGHPLKKARCALSWDGKLAATSQLLGRVEEAVIDIWDTTTGTKLISFPVRTPEVRELAFSPDGKRLATMGGLRDSTRVMIWDVATGQQAFSLQGHINAVSYAAFSSDGKRLATGGLDQVVRVWETDASPEDQATRRQALAESMVYWHQQQDSAAQESGLWVAALFHLDRLIEARPQSGTYLARRGYVHARMDQMEKAAADFSKAAELGIANLDDWHRAVLLVLKLGNVKKGYQKVCPVLLKGYITGNPLATITDVRNLNGFLWMCTLGADGLTDYAPLVEAADKLVTRGGKSYPNLNTRGAVLYRAGKLEEAIKQFDDAIKAHRQGGTAFDWLFLAMAHHRAGRKEEAEKWLQKAIQWIDQAKKVNPGSVPGGPEFSWEVQMEFEILRTEAEALVKGTAGAPGSKP